MQLRRLQHACWPRRSLSMDMLEKLLVCARDCDAWHAYDVSSVVAAYRKKRYVRTLCAERSDKGKRRRAQGSKEQDLKESASDPDSASDNESEESLSDPSSGSGSSSTSDIGSDSSDCDTSGSD